jgi:hypothetical protein
MKWPIMLDVAAKASASVPVKINMTPFWKFSSLAGLLGFLCKFTFCMRSGLFRGAFPFYVTALVTPHLNDSFLMLNFVRVAGVEFLSVALFLVPFHQTTLVDTLPVMRVWRSLLLG